MPFPGHHVIFKPSFYQRWFENCRVLHIHYLLIRSKNWVKHGVCSILNPDTAQFNQQTLKHKRDTALLDLCGLYGISQFSRGVKGPRVSPSPDQWGVWSTSVSWLGASTARPPNSCVNNPGVAATAHVSRTRCWSTESHCCRGGTGTLTDSPDISSFSTTFCFLFVKRLWIYMSLLGIFLFGFLFAWRKKLLKGLFGLWACLVRLEDRHLCLCWL